MRYIIEQIPCPGSEANPGPKQRVQAMQSLGPNQCLTLDLSDEKRPERIRVLWCVSASRANIPVRTKIADDDSGRLVLRIWRLDA